MKNHKYKSPSPIHRSLWGKGGGGFHCITIKKNNRQKTKYICRLEEKKSKEDKINV